MNRSVLGVIIALIGVIALNRIKELRLSKGMKQTDLAKLLKCAPTAVSKYELEQLDISSSIIRSLCDIFGCTADYLLGRSPVASPQLTPEEEEILLALRNADDRARDMVALALEPFRQDASEKKAI